MRKFVQANLVPPSGYYYIIPETGVELVAGDFDSLVLMVRRHYVSNRIVVPASLDGLIENFLCIHNDPSMCKGEYRKGDAQSVMINTGKIREATRMVGIRLKWNRCEFLTPPMEAERRAAICVKCPDNYLGICTTCNGLKDYVIQAIGDRTTTVDNKLGVCTHCSCLLKAKIHISDKALRATYGAEEFAKYPSHCWLTALNKQEEPA